MGHELESVAGPLPSDPEQPQIDKSPKRKSTGIGIVAAIVVTLLCIGGFGLAGMVGGSHPGASTDGAVIAFCEDAVKGRLVSPSSAKFFGEKLVNADNTYGLSGSVDSQNRFGVWLRSDFACFAQWAGSAWALVSLDVG